MLRLNSLGYAAASPSVRIFSGRRQVNSSNHSRHGCENGVLGYKLIGLVTVLKVLILGYRLELKLEP